MTDSVPIEQRVEQCPHTVAMRCGLPHGHKGKCVPKMWEPEDCSWFVEELSSDGRNWHRAATAHMWAKEKDAMSQLRQLQKLYPNRDYRLRGP